MDCDNTYARSVTIVVSIDYCDQTCLKMQMFVMSKLLQMSASFEDILGGIIR